jgi:hypothetical protein
MPKRNEKEKSVSKTVFEMVAFNANDQTRAIIFDCDGVMVEQSEYDKVKIACGAGPYFCFFAHQESNLYRFRGPFNGERQFWAIDETMITLSSKETRDITKTAVLKANDHE